MAAYDYTWIKDGVLVWYQNPIGGGRECTFAGVVDGAPFKMGPWKHSRPAVRLKRMEERYVQLWGRTVVSCALLKSVTPRKGSR